MKAWLKTVLGIIAVGVIIQFVPYGRDRTNPAIKAEPHWDAPRTRELFFQACQDCHSNQTRWPWYAGIAPGSWLMQWDVEEGRSHFNVSEWGRDKNHGDEAAEMVREGEMPLWYYLPAHPEARLTAAETAELISGLERTFPEVHPEAGTGKGHH